MRSVWVKGPGRTIAMDTHGDTTRVIVVTGFELRSVNTFTWGEFRTPDVTTRRISLKCTDRSSVHFMGSRMLYGCEDDVYCVNLRDENLRPRAVACPCHWVRDGKVLARFYSFADTVVAVAPSGHGLYRLVGSKTPASAIVMYS